MTEEVWAASLATMTSKMDDDELASHDGELNRSTPCVLARSYHSCDVLVSSRLSIFPIVRDK